MSSPPPNLPPPPPQPNARPSLPDLPHVPPIKPRRRAVRLATWGFILVALLGLYVQAPYRICHSLKTAVAEGRADVLEKYIGFDSVTKSLMDQLKQRLDVKVLGNPDATAARQYDSRYVLEVVNQTLRPGEGQNGTAMVKLAKILAADNNWQATARFPFFSGATEFEATVQHIKFKFAAPAAGRFALGGQDSPIEMDFQAPEARLRFEFGNWTWKLTAIELPKPVTCDITVFIPPPPVITEQPHDVVVLENRSATLKVEATGARPLSFQWRRNGVEVSNGRNQTLYLGPAGTDAAGFYDVVVKNGAGSVTSSVATVTLSQQPPPPSWNGAWRINDKDELSLAHDQSSGRVTGTLKSVDGKTLFAVSGSASGNRLTGSFVRGGSRIPSGSFELTMEAEGKSFSGTMRNRAGAFNWRGEQISNTR